MLSYTQPYNSSQSVVPSLEHQHLGPTEFETLGQSPTIYGEQALHGIQIYV